jgi:DNA-binding NtrC family response regulator
MSRCGPESVAAPAAIGASLSGVVCFTIPAGTFSLGWGETTSMSDDRPAILLVDDDPDICQNLSDILHDLDFQVDMASHGEAALAKVGTTAYDLALIDLRMPGMDGLTLYREIKRQSPGTLAILITGHADRDTVESALRSGIVQVLSKPLSVPRLCQVVAEVLDRPLVLIVDDDRELCANLWDILRSRGFRVFMAHDRDEAADHVRDRRFQVVLIDMKLPGGDGRSVFQLVHQANPEARTVVISGHRGEVEPLASWLLDQGVDAICYKPFEVERLLDTISELAN